MKDNIVSKLTRDGDGIQTLSIVGVGGLGKTTLAQLIFRDPHFADWLKIWVCVSTPFVVNVVAANIFSLAVILAEQETTPEYNHQPESALQNLMKAISDKKYLLVLDDVWTEDKKEWEPLKVALEKGKPGSKILVTTRSKKVAHAVGTLKDDIFRPKHLTDDECWEILRNTTKKENREFQEVGMKLASKCKGLPLAAVVLGNFLTYKTLDMWKNLVKSEIWKLKNPKVELFPVWVLSYNDLSADLKRCFSYCAVYPKDHKIHAETLIEEWMAQGYLGTGSGNGELEQIGQENLNNLAMRCLFQDIEKSESGEQIVWCKMHDIVHDFAEYLRENDMAEYLGENGDKGTSSCQVCGQSWVSRVQEYRSLSWDCRAHPEKKKSSHICNCLKSVRMLRIKNKDPVPEMNTLIHLRRLHLDLCDHLSNDKFKIICGLYFMQNLKLTYCNLSGIPQEIGNLVKLRRLDLSGNSGIHELPDTMYNLVGLRSLFISYCSLEVISEKIEKLVQLRQLDLSRNQGLKKLPESIRSLVELRILNIERTGIECLPRAIDELSELCTLEMTVFKVGSSYNKFRLLKNLSHLRFTGTLKLEIYCSIKDELQELATDTQEAPFENLFEKLKTLDIDFRAKMVETEESSLTWLEVVQALLPEEKLEKLIIWGYKGFMLPDCMSSPFNFVKSINLNWMTKVSSLPAMGKLPFLEDLYIAISKQLKLVGPEFLGIEPSCESGVAFPELKKLQFGSCEKWEEWEDITEKQGANEAICIMPRLTKMNIISCPSLKKLPHRLFYKAASEDLGVLNIFGSTELVKTYVEDNKGSGWTSISLTFPNLVLLQEQLPF